MKTKAYFKVIPVFYAWGGVGFSSIEYLIKWLPTYNSRIDSGWFDSLWIMELDE